MTSYVKVDVLNKLLPSVSIQPGPISMWSVSVFGGRVFLEKLRIDRLCLLWLDPEQFCLFALPPGQFAGLRELPPMIGQRV